MNTLTGDKAEIFCRISNLPLGVTVNWKKNGEPFDTPNERVKFLDNNRKIEFSSVYPEDAGGYECTANDEIGTTYSTNVKVFGDGKHSLVCLKLMGKLLNNYFMCRICKKKKKLNCKLSDTLRQTDVYGNPTFLLSQLDKPLDDLNIGNLNPII